MVQVSEQTRNVVARMLKEAGARPFVIENFESAPIHNVFGAWSVGLSRTNYPRTLSVMGHTITPQTKWHLSVKLRKNSSTEDDWGFFGALLALFGVPPEVMRGQDHVVRSNPCATFTYYY